MRRWVLKIPFLCPVGLTPPLGRYPDSSYPLCACLDSHAQVPVLVSLGQKMSAPSVLVLPQPFYQVILLTPYSATT